MKIASDKKKDEKWHFDLSLCDFQSLKFKFVQVFISPTTSQLHHHHWKKKKKNTHTHTHTQSKQNHSHNRSHHSHHCPHQIPLKSSKPQLTKPTTHQKIISITTSTTHQIATCNPQLEPPTAIT